MAIEGWLAVEEAEWLFDRARSVAHDGRVVEIGSYKGRSTAAITFACVGTQRRVFAIDKWQGMYFDIEAIPEVHAVFEQGFYDEWQHNMIENGLLSYVTPLVGTSEAIAAAWRAPIDMIFIDGSHRYEDVVRDFELFYPYVVSGGTILFHDVVPQWEGSWRAFYEYAVPRLDNPGCFVTIGHGTKS